MGDTGRKHKQPLGDKILPVAERAAYNLRLKIITDREGKSWLIQRMASDRLIWGSGYEKADSPKKRTVVIKSDRDALKEMDTEDLQRLAALDDPSAKLRAVLAALPEVPLQRHREDIERATRRAVAKATDYILADWHLDFFVTLTLDPEKIDRYDPAAACKALQGWCKNRVQRRGLRYLFVGEFHKDGAVHFHGVINGEAVTLVDSGTVLPPDGGKPIKRATAKRKGLDPDALRVVYNLPEWEHGYSTAIQIQEDPEQGGRLRVARYIAKYITKAVEYSGGDLRKIGGRYYWHSHNLTAPQMIYALTDYETEDGFEIETGGCAIKVTNCHTEFCRPEKRTVSKMGPFTAAMHADAEKG